MPQPPTGSLTPRLSEVARHVVIPSGIVTTAWPRIVAQSREMGVEFDPWQHGIGTVALGKREDGKYAATVGGIVLSIPRQVGKTFLVGMIVIAMCALHPGLTVLWSAHRTRTSTKTFGSLKGMTSRKKIAPFMLEPRNTNGEQEIRFKNGSVIMFGAREAGFGRGFDEVDIEVFDEAQILTEKALEDMIAATNQSRHEAGALLFFMGTPPRPGDPGEEFSNRRADALSGNSEDMVYVEFSADPDANPEDWDQIAKANPSYPLHTPREAILRMRKNLTNVDSFMREGLGVWDSPEKRSVIPADLWEKRTDPGSSIAGPVVFAAEMANTRAGATIAAAGRRSDGRVHVELVRVGTGTGWLLDELIRLCLAWEAPIFIDALSPAASLIPALEEADVNFVKTTTGDMVKACGSFYDNVQHGELVHMGDPVLAKVLPTASQRSLMGGWAWDRKSGEIGSLIAVTLAAYGVLLQPDTGPAPQIHDWPDDETLKTWEADEW